MSTLYHHIKSEISKKRHILGIATATGSTAIYARESGADFIMMLNSGKFRQMGRSSLGGFLPFRNCNEQIMEIAETELLPTLGEFPAIIGINATDPTLDRISIFKKIKRLQISGVVNYPTVCLFDGKFREALTEQNITFDQEIAFLKSAKSEGLFTVGFVTTVPEAISMSLVHVDIICIHLGLTEGGNLGAKRLINIQEMVNLVEEICDALSEANSKSAIMVYGGAFNDLNEVRFLYNTVPEVVGYIGGSTFERIDAEQFMKGQIREFKFADKTKDNSFTMQILEGIEKYYDYVDFIKAFISENYSVTIQLSELATLTGLNANYLGELFKKKTGVTFSKYLITFRMNKAIELMENNVLTLSEIANLVGYSDYAQFNKIFKKQFHLSPKEYRNMRI